VCIFSTCVCNVTQFVPVVCSAHLFELWDVCIVCCGVCSCLHSSVIEWVASERWFSLCKSRVWVCVCEERCCENATEMSVKWAHSPPPPPHILSVSFISRERSVCLLLSLLRSALHISWITADICTRDWFRGQTFGGYVTIRIGAFHVTSSVNCIISFLIKRTLYSLIITFFKYIRILYIGK